MKPIISLMNEGAYLFKAPASVKIELNRNLLVVFSISEFKSLSLVLTDSTTQPKALHEMLNRALKKLLKYTQLLSSKIRTRIFGLSMGNPILYQETMNWLKKHALFPSVQDLGKNVTRSVLIDCADGKIGVSYAALDPEVVADFLPSTTARDRFPDSIDDVKVLILSSSKVNRILTKQAVEEYLNWKAEVPQSPEIWVVDEQDGDFPWSIVLIFDDWNMTPPAVKWLHKAAKRNPSTLFGWIGGSPPALSGLIPKLTFLPRPEPEFLGEFKQRLANYFWESWEKTRLPWGHLQFQKNA